MRKEALQADESIGVNYQFNTINSKKVGKAQELIDILKNLSSCPRYDEESEDCKNCTFFLKLRSESARRNKDEHFGKHDSFGDNTWG